MNVCKNTFYELHTHPVLHTAVKECVLALEKEHVLQIILLIQY